MNVTLRDHIKVNELAEKTRTHTTLLKYWMTQLALRSMVNKRIGLGRTTLHDNTVSLPISLSTLTLSISFTHPHVTAHCSHGSVVESKRCILRKHLIVNLHIYSTCLIRPLIISRSFFICASMETLRWLNSNLLFPFHCVQWAQNSSNLSKLFISQANLFLSCICENEQNKVMWPRETLCLILRCF